MAVQTTYSTEFTDLTVGQIARQEMCNVISRVSAESGGLPFGRAVKRGSAGDDCLLLTTGDASTDFLGITVIDRSISPGANPDEYNPEDDVAILDFGVVGVTAAANVTAGDPVFMVPASGAFTNVAGTGNIALPAVWDATVTANTIAAIRVSR